MAGNDAIRDFENPLDTRGSGLHRIECHVAATGDRLFRIFNGIAGQDNAPLVSRFQHQAVGTRSMPG